MTSINRNVCVCIVLLRSASELSLKLSLDSLAFWTPLQALLGLITKWHVNIGYLEAEDKLSSSV